MGSTIPANCVEQKQIFHLSPMIGIKYVQNLTLSQYTKLTQFCHKNIFKPLSSLIDKS